MKKLALCILALSLAACTPAPQTPSSASTYQNATFGFELTMTEAWEDYQVQESTLQEDFENPEQTTTILSFLSPTAFDPSGYSDIFNILVHDRAVWDAAKAECFEATEDPINNCYWLAEENIQLKTKNYVFTSAHINGFPEDDQQQALDDYETVIGSMRALQ